MVELVRSYIADGVGLVQLAAVLVVGATVLGTWSRTKNAVATAGAMVVGALVIGYTLNAEWLGRRVSEDIVSRENGMPVLTGAVLPVTADQLEALTLLWLRTAITALWVLGATLALALVLRLSGWRFDVGTPRRGLRRAFLRGRWASSCRSTGLGITKDKRRVTGLSAPSLVALLTAPLDKVPAPSGMAKAQTVERLPRLSGGRASPSRAAVIYDVRPPRGGSLDDIAAKVDHLAAALGVHQVALERVRPDHGRLIVTLRDELSRSRPWPGPGSGVGVTSTGDPLRMPLIEGHWLLAGVTRSGKSAWLNALLAELVTSNVPRRLIGIDPKIVELSLWAPVFDRLIVDPAEAGDALAAVHHEVTGRYQRLAEQGTRKLHRPTEDMPLLVVVIDELAELARQGPGESKEAPKDRLRIVGQLAAIGAAAGCVLICATQRPSATLIGSDLRANLTRRVCCRVSDEYGGEATLGPVAAQLRPWDIDARTKGVAWVVSEAHMHPQRARSFWLEEHEVAAIARAHPAPRPAELVAVTS